MKKNAEPHDIEQDAIQTSGPEGTFVRLPRAALYPNPWNRKSFDPARLQELADSILANGIVEPLIVRPHDRSQGFTEYEIIAGERRWKAAGLANLDTLPCLVRELNDNDAQVITAIENLQREDLNPLDEAQGYARLLRELDCAVEEIEARVGRKRSHIYAMLRLLKLPEKVQKLVSDGTLDHTVAGLVATIGDPKDQAAAVARIVKQNMSFRETKDYIEIHYRLDLNRRPFPTDQPLADKPACLQCPHHSSNLGEGRNICTKPSCADEKLTAWLRHLAEMERAAGREVDTSGAPIWAIGYEPGDGVQMDTKGRTYEQIIGKKLPLVVVFDRAGERIELYRKHEADEFLEKAGITVRKEYRELSEDERKARDRERMISRTVEKGVLAFKVQTIVQSIQKLGTINNPLGRVIYQIVAILDGVDFINHEAITKRRSWPTDKHILEHVANLDGTDVLAFLAECCLTDTYDDSYIDERVDVMLTDLHATPSAATLTKLENALRADAEGPAPAAAIEEPAPEPKKAKKSTKAKASKKAAVKPTKRATKAKK